MMKKPFLQGYGEGMVLLFSFLIVIAGFVLFFVVLAVISLVLQIPLESFNSIQNNGMDPKFMLVTRTGLIVQGITIFIIPSIVAAYCITRHPFQYLGLKKGILFNQAVFAVLSILLAIPLINFLSYANQQMVMPDFLKGFENWMLEKENAANDISLVFLKVSTVRGLLINIVMIGVLPAIGEEMVFRGLVQKPLANIAHNKHTAVLITAFLFAFIHFQFFTFLPRFALGIFLGYLYLWSGNLWYPVLAHFANNAFVVITYFAINLTGTGFNPDTVGLSSEVLIFSMASILLMALFIYLFRANALFNRHQG